MTKLVYLYYLTQLSTPLSLLIQNASKSGMQQLVLFKVCLEIWLKKKSLVSVRITGRESYLSETREVDAFLLISKMVLKWRNSRKVRNLRTRTKKIFLACIIGVLELNSCQPHGMVNSGFLMITQQLRREPLNTRWTSTKIVWTTLISD